jgi:hypothetical protein
MRQRLEPRFLVLHLSLGLLWLWLLPLIADGSPKVAAPADQIRWMLLWAGWFPSLPLAIWQSRGSGRWRRLLLSDLLFSLALILLSCSLYLPLFFTLIPWFWLFALPPRGMLTAGVLRLIGLASRCPPPAGW